MKALVLAALLAAPAAAQLEPVAKVALPDQVKPRGGAFSADGKLLALSGSDDKVRLYDLANGALLRTWETGPAGVLALASDGRWVATGDAHGNVTFHDARDGGAPRRFATGGIGFFALVPSPDDALLAVIPRGAPAELWEVSSGRRRARLATEFGGTRGGAFSPDGSLFATADDDTRVRLWRTVDGALASASEEALLEPFTVDFAPDGSALLAGGADRAITILDPTTAKVRRHLAPGPDPILHVAALARGRAAAATMHAENMALPAPLLLVDLAKGETREVTKALRAIAGGATRDGRLLVATSDGERVLVSSLR